MRKIESQMNNAVKNKIAWSKDNTLTTFSTISDKFIIKLKGINVN